MAVVDSLQRVTCWSQVCPAALPIVYIYTHNVLLSYMVNSHLSSVNGIGSETLLWEVTNDFRLTTRGHRFCHASYKCLCGLMCTGRVVKQILKAVERQFPAELDTAVTSWLEVGQSFFFYSWLFMKPWQV
jgi:hypothetical protein